MQEHFDPMQQERRVDVVDCSIVDSEAENVSAHFP